eukprot:1153084-Pelagomonas_calceolata.AAC.2
MRSADALIMHTADALSRCTQQMHSVNALSTCSEHSCSPAPRVPTWQTMSTPFWICVCLSAPSAVVTILQLIIIIIPT